ncbi:MAG: hypothetical protein IRZ21_07935 [Thermoleophilaceae bacterium]|nr:hypothetical protein [Thermoleophilaceae bacterium]
MLDVAAGLRHTTGALARKPSSVQQSLHNILRNSVPKASKGTSTSRPELLS